MKIGTLQSLFPEYIFTADMIHMPEISITEIIILG
jgi:hypothetical protein